MAKYTVNVHVMKVDDKGGQKQETFDYIFENENILTARREAIKKAKDLFALFSEIEDDKETFSTPLEANIKDYKDFNAYSIDVVFSIDEEMTYDILGGDEELQVSSLEQEAMYFKEHNIPVKYTERYNDESEEEVEVIAEDLDFLFAPEHV